MGVRGVATARSCSSPSAKHSIAESVTMAAKAAGDSSRRPSEIWLPGLYHLRTIRFDLPCPRLRQAGAAAPALESYFVIEFLEPNPLLFFDAPLADTGYVHPLPTSDLDRRSQALTIVPEIECGQPVAA